MSSVISFYMKDNNIEPMDLLPRWAYIQSEWNDIIYQTVSIIDGIRYKKKEPEDIAIIDVEDFINAFLS